MKKILLILLLLLGLNLSFASEPNQEDVPIFDLVKCNMFNVFCKIEKSVVNSAYGMQETNYILINNTFSNVNSIQVLDHDPFIKDLNQFFMKIIYLIYQLFFIYIFWSFMTNGGDLYKEIKAKENLKNLIKGLFLITILPLLIILTNDFFFQLNQVFINASNISDFALIPFTAEMNAFSFWIATFFVWINSLFLSVLVFLYKIFLFFSTTLITLIGALWFIKKDLARLLRDFLVLSYLHVPILVILLNVFTIIMKSESNHWVSFIGLTFILLIFISLNLYILMSSVMKKFAKHIETATKKAHYYTKSGKGHIDELVDKRKKEKAERLHKENLYKSNENLRNEKETLEKNYNQVKQEKDLNDFYSASRAYMESIKK